MMTKFTVAFIAIISLGACKSTSNKTKTIVEDTKPMVSENNCPEAGSCVFELKRNVSMSIAKDATAAIYPKYSDHSGDVMMFTYAEKGPKGTADGDYSESIMFNVPTFRESVVYKDAELGKLQLLFNKQCFCRGEAGYYRIMNGTLTLFKNPDKSIGFELDFSVPETSHKLSKIKN